MLALFVVTGCGKKQAEPDENLIKAKGNALMSILQSTDTETLTKFKERSDFIHESQVASLEVPDMVTGNTIDLSDTKVEDFMGIVEAWLAADEELGGFKSIDGNGEIAQEGSNATVTYKAKYKDRDADIILSFDAASSRLENMTVNGDYSRGDVLKKAALNTLLGMGTVFCVLIIIMLVISLFKFLPGVDTGKKKEKQAAPAEAAKAAPAPAAAAEKAADNTEIQAVIAAAIAAYQEETGQDTSGYFVRKIVRKHR